MVVISANMVAPYEVGKPVRSYVNIPHSRGIRYTKTGVLTLNLAPHLVPAAHHQHPSTPQQHPSSLQQASTLHHGESEDRMTSGAVGTENFKKRKFSEVAKEPVTYK